MRAVCQDRLVEEDQGADGLVPAGLRQPPLHGHVGQERPDVPPPATRPASATGPRARASPGARAAPPASSRTCAGVSPRP